MFFARKFNEVDVAQAKALIGQGVVLVDVRRFDDYAQAHIEGALLLEKEGIEHFIDRNDKSMSVLCYCYKGISSKAACQKLAESGFRKVSSLKGGFEAWEQAGEKVVS